MTKSDLKTGDIVERRDGIRMLVMAKSLITIGICDDEEVLGVGKLSQYDDNLHFLYGDNSADIMKVRKSSDPKSSYKFSDLKYLFDNDNHWQNICWNWIREEVREVTMAEVEERFGCKVKIIKENNND